MCKLVSKVGTTHLIDSALLGRTDLPELDPSRDLLLIARAPLKTDIHTNTNTLTTIIITKAHKMITSHVYEELHFPKTIQFDMGKMKLVIIYGTVDCSQENAELLIGYKFCVSNFRILRFLKLYENVFVRFKDTCEESSKCALSTQINSYS